MYCRLSELVRFALVCVATMVVSCVMSVPSAIAQDAPICDLDPDPCDVENFQGTTTGNKGANYTSPDGFVFDAYNAGDFYIEDHDWTEKNLFFSCNASFVELPQERQYVNLVYNGFSARINFIAVDSSGNVVDETTKRNQTGEGAQVVTLGPSADPLISRIYMHHVGDSCDSYTCGEPTLSEIRACNINNVNN
jgi:hypothetical protein